MDGWMDGWMDGRLDITPKTTDQKSKIELYVLVNPKQK